MIVRELLTSFGIKADKKGFNDVNSGLNGIVSLAKGAVAAVAAFGAVRWVQGIVEQTVALGDRFNDLSQRTGISATTLQKFDYAAKMTGANLSDVETGLRKLQIAQSNAASGNAAAAKEFKNLGISIKGSDGKLKSSTDLIFDVADKMQGLKSDSERTAIAVKLFGRSGTTLIPMLKEGGKSIKDMMQEMEDLGAVMGDDLVSASDEFGDQQIRINAALQGVKNTITKALLPKIKELTDKFIRWWKVNKDIVKQKVEKVFNRIADSVRETIDAVSNALIFIKDLVSRLSPLQKGILLVAVALFVLNKIIKSGPIGKFLLIVSAILLVLEDWNVFLKGGNSLIGDIFKKLKDWTGLDFAGPVKEFAKGIAELAKDPKPFDWGAYFGEMWSVTKEYLSAAADEWKNILQGVWDWIYSVFVGSNPIMTWIRESFAACLSFVESIVTVMSAIPAFLVGMWDSPREAWNNFKNTVGESISDFVEKAKKAFGSLITLLEKGFKYYKKAEEKIGGWLGLDKKEEQAGGAGPAPKYVNQPKSPEQKFRAELGKRKEQLAAFEEKMKATPGAMKNKGVNEAIIKARQEIYASQMQLNRPAGGGGGGGGTHISAPLTANITVNPSAGMDENAIASKILKTVKSEAARQNKAAMDALLAAKAG